MTDHSHSNSSPKAGSPTVTIAGLAPEAEAILKKRGLDTELAKKLGWRSSKGTNGKLEIPYMKNGVEVNCKTRTLVGEKSFSQVSGGEKCFYNFDAIETWKQGADVLLICEGEMDCLAAMQYGYLAVSVPDGAPSSQLDDGTIKYSYLDDFPPTGIVIICADGDAPGANLLHDLGLRLGRHRCKWVKYPQGCKDLNDALIAFGEKGLRKTIERAQWLAVDGIYRMGELPPLPVQEGIPLDIFPITIRKADFSVWTGIPSHGKSTLLNYIAHCVAEKGWNVGFASFEQPAQTQHRYALRCLALNMPLKSAKFDEVAHVDKWIDEKYSFIVPNIDSDDEITLGWLLEKMAAAAVRHQVSMFVVDPWNSLDHDPGKDMTQTAYTGFAVKQLKKFATRYQVHVAVVAHPAKMQRIKGKDKYPTPTLYDIADSAHWANKADLGVVVHRDDGQTLVRVQKSRYHQDIGKPDDYYLEYDDDTKRYRKTGAVFSCV